MVTLLLLISFPIVLNGYFEGEYLAQKSRLPVNWDMWNPKNYFEMKFTVNPSPGLNGFFSLSALSNSNGMRFFMNQGHLSYRTSNTETTIFSREDRFWISSPLLFLVNTDRVKDDAWGPKAEGVRMDLWEWKGFYATGIASKFRTWDGEAYLASLTKKFGDRFEIGSIYLKKDWRGPGNSFNSVYSINGKTHIKGPLNLRFEVARSIHPSQLTPRKSDDYAFELEFRRIRLRNLSIAWSFFNYGIDFIDEFSNKFNLNFDREFDRRGVYGEFVYLVPYKAVNLIYKTRYWESRFDETYPGFLLPHRYNKWWNYGEIYIEYYGGVSSKFYVESLKDTAQTWNHLFFEIGGENNLMKLRLQYKIMDLGINRNGQSVYYSIGERHLIGAELRVNLTQNLFFYSRAAVGMGVGRSWESLFLQLGYRGIKNTEIFLEYGEPGHTDGDLVNDWDFSNNPYLRTEDKAKLLVKYWF
jgi:hypothetical protein